MPATKRAASRVPVTTEPISQKSDVETWRNDTHGIVTINRVGEYGRKVVDIVHGGRTFELTPQERRMNQHACANTTLDMFTNGTLRPIDLIEDEPDTELLKTNPNTFSDEDLPKLFRLKAIQFAERIGLITNSAVLSRIAELARDPGLEATLAQYEAIKAREVELGPVDRPRGTPGPPPGGVGRPVTPK